MTIGQLFVWSAKPGEWASCPPAEITWLDRALLSDNEDTTLHRAPRCAGLRYVHHGWELFSRDPSHRVYLAPDVDGPIPDAELVRRTASHVLPVAPARYEALPVPLDGGRWLVSVGSWVARLRHEPERPQVEPTRGGDTGAITRESPFTNRAAAADADAEAVARVRSYFQRNAGARLAMAYYYQEFILSQPTPQPVPMMNVVIALNLSGEGAVSDYKKLLQGFIWRKRGHARDLAGFLLSNGLLTPADLDEARQLAAENERAGICEQARRRLKYRPKVT